MPVQGFTVNVANAEVTALVVDASLLTVTMTVVVPASDVAVNFRHDTRLVRHDK